MLLLAGIVMFSLSIAVSVTWLPKACTYVCLYNTVSMTAYTGKLSNHWTTKNLTMGSIALTPTLIGWAAGTHFDPAIPYSLVVGFLAHCAREATKDVEDIHANHGRRVTLPMVLGPTKVMRISGTLALLSAGVMVLMLKFSMSTLSSGLLVMGVGVLVFTGHSLLTKTSIGQEKTLITTALALGLGGLM